MTVKKAHVGAVFAGMALTAVLTGCSSSTIPDAGQNPPSSDDQGTGALSPGLPSTSAQPAVAVSQSTRCGIGDLELSRGHAGVAAGTTYQTLRLTNVSRRPCTLQGYPGVSYVAGEDGHQVGAAASRNPGGGGVVKLGSGQSASTVVALANVDNYDAETCRPQPVRGLRIYPPGETRSTFVALRGATGCANAKINQLGVEALRPGPGE